MPGLEVVEGQPALVDAEVIQWQDAAEIRATDPVAALDEASDDPPGGCRIAEPCRAHQRLDIIVGERHDLLRRPERIVRQPVGEWSDDIVGCPAIGIERREVEMADAAELRKVSAHPRRRVDAHSRHVGGDRWDAGVDPLVTFPRALWPAEQAAAKRFGEIEQVMADMWHAPVLDEDVGRVHRPHGSEVEPGAEYEQPAEIAPMFVRDDVVRVIGAHAEDLVWTEESALFTGQTRRNGPVRRSGSGRDRAQESIDVSLSERSRFPARGHCQSAFRRGELPPVEPDDVVLGDVIAQRVQTPGGDHFGARRELFMPGRIEPQEIRIAASIGREQSRPETGRLHHEHLQRFGQERR